jgi:hypothetical protein
MPGRTEHDLGARRAAARRVSREIVGTHVSFGLYDAPDALAGIVNVYEMQTDELARDA